MSLIRHWRRRSPTRYGQIWYLYVTVYVTCMWSAFLTTSLNPTRSRWFGQRYQGGRTFSWIVVSPVSVSPNVLRILFPPERLSQMNGVKTGLRHLQLLWKIISEPSLSFLHRGTLVWISFFGSHIVSCHGSYLVTFRFQECSIPPCQWSRNSQIWFPQSHSVPHERETSNHHTWRIWWSMCLVKEGRDLVRVLSSWPSGGKRPCEDGGGVDLLFIMNR